MYLHRKKWFTPNDVLTITGTLENVIHIRAFDKLNKLFINRRLFTLLKTI